MISKTYRSHWLNWYWTETLKRSQFLLIPGCSWFPSPALTLMPFPVSLSLTLRSHLNPSVPFDMVLLRSAVRPTDSLKTPQVAKGALRPNQQSCGQHAKGSTDMLCLSTDRLKPPVHQSTAQWEKLARIRQSIYRHLYCTLFYRDIQYKSCTFYNCAVYVFSRTWRMIDLSICMGTGTDCDTESRICHHMGHVWFML